MVGTQEDCLVGESEARPFIQPFANLGKYYFYDVNRHKIVRISENCYNSLTTVTYGNIGEPSVEICTLRSQGFLSGNRPIEIRHPSDESVADLLQKRILKLCLQVTQQCNFRCRYCVYSGSYVNRRHSAKRMTWDIARKGIDFLLDRSRDTPFIDVSFYGGEPLLEFELIQRCVAYVESQAKGKRVSYHITTNGSLLTKDVVEFLSSLPLNLTVSLDGPKEVHDRNRRLSGNEGSFDLVYANIQMIKHDFPDFLSRVSFSVVIDPTIQA